MKLVKKLTGILLSVLMVFSMMTTVFAATATISAPEGSTRSYDVYQIFTGDLHEGVLSNVKWGKNGTGTMGTAVDSSDLAELEALSGTDVENLATIETYVNLESEKFGTVSAGPPLTVPTGYYLIKDNGPVGEGEAYSLYIVQIVGSITIEPKVGTTVSEKKVDDKNDSNTTEDGISWQDSADYDIGDAVPFQLKATIAEDYDNYTVYQLVFHDEECEGLTFQENTVKVYVDGTPIESGYTVVTENLEDGCTFEVRFADLKQIANVNAGSVITVTYESILNENAVVGAVGNKNTSYVQYSNNPNWTPGEGEGPEDSPTGTTPKDVVIVFTYKTIVNKVDENDEPLTGAEFTLEKFVADENGAETYKDVKGNWVAKTVVKNGEGTTFTFSGLDDGDYRLTETTTPAGYNTIDDIYFTVTAEHDVLSDNPALTSLNGNVTTGKITFASDVTEGSLTTNVVNLPGATLPTTGGMGTTLFYVVGAILALGAGVLLVTKRRMKGEK